MGSGTHGGDGPDAGRDDNSTCRFSALLITIAVTAGLDAYSVYVSGICPGSGISFVYPGIVFIIVFGIWFGFWGVLGAYVGTLLGGLISSVDPTFLLLMKTANMDQALVPALAYRYIRTRIFIDAGKYRLCLHHATSDSHRQCSARWSIDWATYETRSI